MKETLLRLYYFFIAITLFSFSFSLHATETELENFAPLTVSSQQHVKLIMAFETVIDGILQVSCQDKHFEIPLHNIPKGAYGLDVTPFVSNHLAARELQCQLIDSKSNLCYLGTYDVAFESPIEYINIFQTFYDNQLAMIIIPNFSNTMTYSHVMTKDELLIHCRSFGVLKKT